MCKYQVHDIEVDIGNGELPLLLLCQDVVQPQVKAFKEMVDELMQSVENNHRRSRRPRYLLTYTLTKNHFCPLNPPQVHTWQIQVSQSYLAMRISIYIA